MANTLNITVAGKGDLTFDFDSKTIIAENTIDTLTAQELADAIRDAEDELLALHFDKIANTAGKTDMGGGVYSGIIVELLDWSLVSGKTSGSFIVSDGTVIKQGSAGNIFGSNPDVSQINLMTQSASIVATGSGVTAQDKQDIADLVASDGYLTEDNFLALK